MRSKQIINAHTPFMLVIVIDLIVMTSTVAFAAQGIITLLIFLPRNLSKEWLVSFCFQKLQMTESKQIPKDLMTNRLIHGNTLYLHPHVSFIAADIVLKKTRNKIRPSISLF
jgi:hypothetical protein